MIIVPIDIWDFGGQKIYYMTHQLFISSMGTYVVVFNGSIHINVESENLTGSNGLSKTGNPVK
jgi:hypothetical protein